MACVWGFALLGDWWECVKVTHVFCVSRLLQYSFHYRVCAHQWHVQFERGHCSEIGRHFEQHLFTNLMPSEGLLIWRAFLIFTDKQEGTEDRVWILSLFEKDCELNHNDIHTLLLRSTLVITEVSLHTFQTRVVLLFAAEMKHILAKQWLPGISLLKLIIWMLHCKVFFTLVWNVVLILNLPQCAFSLFVRETDHVFFWKSWSLWHCNTLQHYHYHTVWKRMTYILAQWIGHYRP